MLKNIRELNRLKIYNKDIRKDDFRDGKLVDFGSSWTEPHCFMGDSNILNATETRIGDLVRFDEMVDMEGIISKWRAMPNWTYKKKLRSYTKRASNSSIYMCLRSVTRPKGRASWRANQVGQCSFGDFIANVDDDQFKKSLRH
uniref:Protein kinase domain-containing protein n=1 Tax=Photinus pyralis TaxID=7054 RepID=A0A1Y1MH60_PHOPY